MSYTIIIVIVILLLMTMIIFFLLKKEIKDINNNSRIYFARKAQEYTDQIKRKEKEEINENDSSEEKEKNEKEDKEIENNSSSIVYLEKKANYEIDGLLMMMKQIDNKFNIDCEEIIKLFLRDYVKQDNEQLDKYNSLKEMKDYIDKIGILNIITSEDDQLINKIIRDLSLINEDVFNEYYLVQEDFQIEEFCNFLEYEMGKCDPTIYIYVGDKDVNYDKFDKRIKTIYSKDIYKGLKIIYLNKLYDFSLS